MDVGPKTCETFAAAVKRAKTIVWNGWAPSALWSPAVHCIAEWCYTYIPCCDCVHWFLWTAFSKRQFCRDANTHTHPFNGPYPGLPGWGGTRKVKPVWILLKQETVSGSGISWAICKSASCSRQITTPTLHHSVFLQAGCPSCRPTNSVKALKVEMLNASMLLPRGPSTLRACMCSHLHSGFWMIGAVLSACPTWCNQRRYVSLSMNLTVKPTGR